MLLLLTLLPAPVCVSARSQGEYTDKGYVAKDKSATSNAVGALPFLVGTVVALFGATFWVVSATS